jgi:hypothetical protein
MLTVKYIFTSISKQLTIYCDLTHHRWTILSSISLAPSPHARQGFKDPGKDAERLVSEDPTQNKYLSFLWFPADFHYIYLEDYHGSS